MKRLLTLFLAFLLLACAFPALAQEEKPVELTVMIRHIGYDKDADNKIARELNERMNVDIEWILSPSENYATQCSMLLASGDYPDAMEFACSRYPNEIQQMADDGIIIPLDGLLAEYGQEILNIRSEDYLWYRSQTDAMIYSISCRMQEYSNNVWEIRQDWLDALGLGIPNNSEELYAVLKAFKENSDLLVGAGNLLIPFGRVQGDSVGLEQLIYGEQGFIANWNDLDGQATYYINMPGFREALSTLRKFYQEGLVEPEWPLMNREQCLEKWYQGIYGMFSDLLDDTDPEWHVYIPNFLNNNPEAKLSFVMPFPDANGRGHITNGTVWNQMVIFSDTTQAQQTALMKLWNYMISEEGSDLVEMGVKGEDWEEIGDTGRAYFYPLAADKERADLGYYSFNWHMKRYYFPRWNSEKTLNTGAAYAANLDFPCVIATTQEYLDNGAVLGDIVSKYKAELICTPDIDFDAVFDTFIQEWNDYGGARWTKEMNEIYQQKKQQ